MRLLIAFSSEEGEHGEKDRAGHAEEGDHDGVEEAPVHGDDVKGIDEKIEHAAGDDVSEEGRDSAADEFHEEQHEERRENKEEYDDRKSCACNGCHGGGSFLKNDSFSVLYRKSPRRSAFFSAVSGSAGNFPPFSGKSLSMRSGIFPAFLGRAEIDRPGGGRYN